MQHSVDQNQSPFAVAIRQIKAAIRIKQPEDQIELRLQLARLYQEEGNELAALNEYMQLHDEGVSGSNGEVKRALKILLFKLNLKLDFYHKMYDEMKKEQKGESLSNEVSLRMLYLQGLALATQDQTMAIKLCQKVEKQLTTRGLSFDTFEHNAFYKSFGALYARVGEEQKAINCFNRVIATQEAEARVYAARGVVHHYLMNFLEAKADFNVSVDCAKKAREVENKKIEAEVRDPCHHAQVYVKAYQEKLLVDEVYARLSQAAFYLDLGQVYEARHEFCYVMALDGVSAEYQLACRMNLKKIDEGLELDDYNDLMAKLKSRPSDQDIPNAILAVAQLAFPSPDETPVSCLTRLAKAISGKSLPFHIMRDVVGHLASHRLSKKAGMLEELKIALTRDELGKAKQEILHFIERSPQMMIKVNLILSALDDASDDASALNVLLSIPKTDRKTALNRGSFKKLVGMLKEIHREDSELVDDLIANFPFKLDRRQAIEKQYPWMKAAGSEAVSYVGGQVGQSRFMLMPLRSAESSAQVLREFR